MSTPRASTKFKPQLLGSIAGIVAVIILAMAWDQKEIALILATGFVMVVKSLAGVSDSD